VTAFKVENYIVHFPHFLSALQVIYGEKKHQRPSAFNTPLTIACTLFFRVCAAAGVIVVSSFPVGNEILHLFESGIRCDVTEREGENIFFIMPRRFSRDYHAIPAVLLLLGERTSTVAHTRTAPVENRILYIIWVCTVSVRWHERKSNKTHTHDERGMEIW
jgi:hypothetical protein